MNNPKISVIMPAYNCENYIGKAIKCIINQTETNWELLIADDGSNDRTRTVINEYKDVRIKYFHNSENTGYLRTWNKLIRESSGNYITFLDADDMCSFKRLELLSKALDEDPTIGVIGSNYQRINEQDEVVFTSDFSLEHNDIINKIPEHFDIVGSAVMLRKEIINTVGGYNEFFNRIGGEDYYWLFLISEKYKIGNISSPLYSYRFNENSVMGNLIKNPEKIFINEIIKHVIYQRKKTGTDDIEKDNYKGLNDLLNERLAAIGRKKSQLYYYVAKRRFYEGHHNLALSLLFQAIKLNPFKLNYYKDYYYFKKNG